jgi:hypothetical protein
MPGPYEVYALMHHGAIYTLRPTVGDLKKAFRWVGFRDGDRCGFFKTRKAFEEFVAREPALAPLGPHAEASFRAETWSTYEGSRVLQQLAENAKKAGGQ